MRSHWIRAIAVAGALGAPVVLAQTRPTSTHAVGPDGSVYYTVRAEGRVMHVAPDGSSEVLADGLDGPTGVFLDTDGNLLVADEVGTHRVDFTAGTIGPIDTEPTPYEPFVRFDQAAWRYRPKGKSVTVVFEHNLGVRKPTFTLEVSKNGGRSWRRVASGLRQATFVWRADAGWPKGWAITRARFRVAAYVDGQRICSDVSDWYELPVALPNSE